MQTALLSTPKVQPKGGRPTWMDEVEDPESHDMASIIGSEMLDTVEETKKRSDAYGTVADGTYW